jgi:integrase
MASAWTEQLPGGGYRGRYRDADNRKQTVTPPDGVSFKRKSDAKTAAVEAAVKAQRRAAIPAGTLPGRTSWGSWWDLIALDRTFDDTDTARTEKAIVEAKLRPKWGTEPLNKITHKLVAEWVKTDLKVGPGMSPGYVRKIFGVFRISIKLAVTDGPLDASPCTGIVLPKVPKRAKPYLAPAAADSMGKHLREDYRDAIDFGLETGLRPGELCGLHADRLDLDRGWMLVAEVLVSRKRVIRPYPKDDDARMIPLTDRAIDIARRRLGQRDVNCGCGVWHTDGGKCGSPLVFLTDRHRMMYPDTLSWHMKQAAGKAKVACRSPYAIRRGFATQAAEGGLDAFQLAEILGHATLTEAQGYVQQTPAARIKLTTALARYPQLTLVEGSGGQSGGRGADVGANPEKQATEDDGSQCGRNTG